MRQIPVSSNQSQSIHQIIRDALRFAAVESTPNGAIDLLGDALTRVAEIIGDRGHA